MLNFNTKARHIILQDKGTASPSVGMCRHSATHC